MTDSTNPYLRQTTQSVAGPSSQPYTPYYSYPWQNNWYPANYQPYYQSQPQHPKTHYAPAPTKPPPSPSPPPPPSPSNYKHWDDVLLSFLREVGLTQAAAGFAADMLVLNPDWEQTKVPGALKNLVKNISLLGTLNSVTADGDEAMDEDVLDTDTVPSGPETTSPLDDRKLTYVHLSNGAQPKSLTSINKEISLFLARNRARNDASNRAEFLYSLAEKEKRRRLVQQGNEEKNSYVLCLDGTPSCARVDAKPVDRDVQMKYDIAKNEEGPLRRTVVAAAVEETERVCGGEGDVKGKGKSREDPGGGPLVVSRPVTAENYPGLDERLRNIETHLAVRYVPSPPTLLLDRLKCLEEHIIRLEKDYPPWAALHFSQPNRGWPPPPRLTPIIVPPQMRFSPATSSGQTSSTTGEVSLKTQNGAVGSGSGVKVKTKTTSSLHRAVLEKLEVQQAMQDLGRPG